MIVGVIVAAAVIFVLLIGVVAWRRYRRSTEQPIDDPISEFGPPLVLLDWPPDDW
jgi:hypothetical protein